jgi:cytochrome c nitrite reductase small subunit
MSPSAALLALACAVGLPAGVGGFTFIYAKGLSYLSSDPRACANCHIMNEQYDGWMKSGHRHAARCVDCHLPAEGLAKWVAKADHGLRHSVAFTLQNFKQPVEITPRDRDLVRASCVRCHAGLVSSILRRPGRDRSPLDCLRCHAGAGH